MGTKLNFDLIASIKWIYSTCESKNIMKSRYSFVMHHIMAPLGQCTEYRILNIKGFTEWWKKARTKKKKNNIKMESVTNSMQIHTGYGLCLSDYRIYRTVCMGGWIRKREKLVAAAIHRKVLCPFAWYSSTRRIHQINVSFCLFHVF